MQRATLQRSKHEHAFCLLRDWCALGNHRSNQRNSGKGKNEMQITTREKTMIDKFNKTLVEVEAVQQRPSDAELAKMTDAEILAGDWLVDIDDSTFWNRWDEANSNLTIR
jgi:hypothetical protein